MRFAPLTRRGTDRLTAMVRRANKALAVISCASGMVGLGACQSEVSLGRWEKTTQPSVAPTNAFVDAGATLTTPPDASLSLTSDPPSSTESAVGTSSASLDASVVPPEGDSAVPPAIPACAENLGAGLLSSRSAEIRGTETATDWSLTEPVSELEWTITIEQDVPPETTEVAYYWHNQFSFVPGVAGRFGLQTRGLYQETPTGPSVATKMAVFWLSGPPLAAELGDIPFPDARAFEMSAAGLRWQTIHAKFDWQVCHTYRFRIGIESTEPDGTTWYGAWITDETTTQVTFLGRMLVPADTGLLSSFSSSRTIPISYSARTCADMRHVSAIFGAPSSTTQTASLVANHFMPPSGCARSIIGNFQQAVRHELGAPVQ